MRPDAPDRGRYSPYAVDWRFLPEDLLLAKDCVRYHLANLSNAAAQTPTLSKPWAATLGLRPLLTVRRAGVLFVHIPKTAGTSISKILYGRNLPHYTAAFWSGVYGEAVRSLPSFSVVRHPIERMFSAYKMAVSGGTDIMAYSRYWRRRLKGLESFDSFVDHVFENRARLLSLPLDLRDQAGFILDGDGRVMVDRLFAFDEAHGLPMELRLWLGALHVPHLNATAPDPIAWTAGSRRKIEEIYGRDFEIYNQLIGTKRTAEARGRRFGDPGVPPLRRQRPV